MPENANMDLQCINTIRTLSMDAVQAANSGHPGTPMALAPVAYCLWQRFLRFDPQDPIWPNRDRFILSAGHASMLLYALLHLTGVKAVSKDFETLGDWWMVDVPASWVRQLPPQPFPAPEAGGPDRFECSRTFLGTPWGSKNKAKPPQRGGLARSSGSQATPDLLGTAIALPVRVPGTLLCRPV
jgi:hypothetical protein